jgi:hypothetical protein
VESGKGESKAWVNEYQLMVESRGRREEQEVNYEDYMNMVPPGALEYPVTWANEFASTFAKPAFAG